MCRNDDRWYASALGSIRLRLSGSEPRKDAFGDRVTVVEAG
jgi:hypothetical protein